MSNSTIDYIALARAQGIHRMTIRRQRVRHIGRALVWAAIVFLALTILYAAVKPALGATDGPPRSHKHRVCIHRDIIISGGSPQLSMCVKWGIR